MGSGFLGLSPVEMHKYRKHLERDDYMQNDLQNYTEQEIQMATYAGNIDIAIGLWEAKDWIAYSRIRQILLALIRGGRGDEVRLPQMQFIFFLNTHLYSRFPENWPDHRMFTADLPKGRTTAEPSWGAATRGEFWSIPL